uniref:Uncharacterized protein MANES_15G182800 n=1 Tax=Rhizophora mucronata TaxID=61149 RepID=A0A2P2KDH3_RHIMU
MEVTDSNEAATRSPLGIDLNEIPASLSSVCPTSAADAAAAASAAQPDRPSDLDSLDVVRSFDENTDPAPGLVEGFPGQQDIETACGACGGNPESPGEVMVCDGCERGFHLACAGVSEILAACPEEWICSECTSGGVKSKRWPLGVKSKRILDINASPPSDADGEGSEELLDSRSCILDGNTSGADANTLNMLNGFNFRKGSGVMMRALRAGFKDMFHRTQTMDRSMQEVDLEFPLVRFSSSNNSAVRLSSRNPSEIFLGGLREFISERHGVLEEGWHVELKQSMNDNEVYAVYCSPDGKTFGSMSEVACHLGLMSNCTIMDTDTRGDGCPSLQEWLHLPKKRKSKRFSVTNGFAENKESLVNGYYKKIASNGQNTQVVDHGPGKVIEEDMEVDDFTRSQQSNEGLPFQFEDFFVLSLGKIDGRPAYHDVSLIWPVGYRSCWHDRVTGSLFMCQVLDGGDSGPLFRVSRFPCSALPLPRGSTLLYRTTVDQSICKNNKGVGRFCHGMDCGNDSSIEVILAEPSPPTECDILRCLSSGSNDINGLWTSDCIQSDILHNRSQNLHSSNMGLGDEIGEISVEHCSSSAAWKMVTQNLIDAYSKTCKQGNSFKFYCNHVDDEIDSSTWDMQDERNMGNFSSLAKFCSSLGFAEIPAEGEPDTLATALLKWLEQDRFGLDTEFVQKMIGQLPGVESCIKYEFQISRGDPSISTTVGNRLLMAKRKRGESDDSFRWSKNSRLVEGLEVDDDCLPPGMPLCSKLPSILAGEFYQVWELLWRFHETLGLKDPFPLEELEEEILNPCCDGSYLFENLEGRVLENQILHLHKGDRIIGQPSSSCDESSMTIGGDNSHAFIPVESRLMKDAAQSRIASISDSSFFGVALTEAHSSLLSVLIGELQLKVAAVVDPSFEPGEWRTKRGRRKDADNSTLVRRSKLHMLPINELTWPELARRYVLAFLSMDGNFDSTEILARESSKVLCCLQGDGGLLCGSLTGVAGMEADALLLAEATRKIFGSLTKEKDVLTLEDEVMDASGACVENNVNDGGLPEWARSLEPVRKLPTNVGTRIRKCVYDALEKNPPEWAQKRLEYSISKEVYKGNASGPTKVLLPETCFLESCSFSAS